MQNEISNALNAARASLLNGVKLSKQAAYARRTPEPISLPHLARARELLEEVLKEEPDNREALLMMSQCCENVLDFEAAESFLTRALEAGEPRSKKRLKRLAMLRECAKAWRDLSLSPEQLRQLGHYLEAEGVGPNHRTMALTEAWLVENAAVDPDRALAGLQRWGGFSDFEVLVNVVYG